ncbi:nucleic-acid-binding protein from transposon X-element [Trichonephila clavipes]|nr:nucleic-acid-binding protein from transposon X-element [Trichonephila clavipes]
MDQEQTEKIQDGLEARKKELSTLVSEIVLIFCPIVDCPSHSNYKSQSDSIMAKPDIKPNHKKLKPKKNNDKIQDTEKSTKKPISSKNDKDNLKNSNKRSGQEVFITPSKFARKVTEIPAEKIDCTSKNKFAVLNVEEAMEVNPPAPTPKIKPLMMRIGKNYNLILQEIYRSYPNTVSKNTGSYIKIQPASAEDHESIKNLLTIKKADHYIIEYPTVIKAVIRGLPSSTDIESELKLKGFAVEKISQLRSFATKSPLPLFMIQIKRSENAVNIYELKNLNYLTVEVVPFRRRPGASQCFNCNFFNHASKNCRMTPRCLECGDSHKTQDCPTKDRLKTLHCINCNVDGHLASSRQCPRFPKQKTMTKKEETPISKKPLNQRQVRPDVSYANVCSNKIEKQMAPREETPKPSNQSPKEKHQDNEEPNFQFEKFATYIITN